jgi:S-adenosylmethionine:tRNA ribosyltransferase-isomerase
MVNGHFDQSYCHDINSLEIVRPVRTADFDFPLPPELIAQHPAPFRDQSRLLVLERASGLISHRSFRDIVTRLRADDLLVLNNSKVIPARLHARNPMTGGAFEILLLSENSPNDWWAMMRPAKRARVGAELTLLDARGNPCDATASVLETNAEGHRRLRFHGVGNIADQLERIGELPLPPYIRRDATSLSAEDRERYQTVYASQRGSVAAPTAGLHFTNELLADLRTRGVQTCHVTLHVGLGTFAPVKAQRVEEHKMHHERFEVGESAAHMINSAKRERRRVVAIGTTSVRVLESIARENDGEIKAGTGQTNIFIHPPCHFHVVDALITNFHLPCSTLLMLVSAFAAPGETRGREMILDAYRDAVAQRYRFFSYGDAMLIE